MGVILEVALEFLRREHLGAHHVPGRKAELADGVSPAVQGAEEGFGGIGANRRHLQRIAVGLVKGTGGGLRVECDQKPFQGARIDRAADRVTNCFQQN